MEIRPEEITRIIREQIKNYEGMLERSETGTVILTGDGIAKVSGMDNCMAGELVEFPGGIYGMAQNLEENTVSVVILGNDGGIDITDFISFLIDQGNNFSEKNAAVNILKFRGCIRKMLSDITQGCRT